MCGIIAYCGTEAALPIVLSGLKRLEYRGYDSAGVAILDAGGAITVFKSAGRINDLHSAVDHTVRGATAIGHTRWATHGRPADYNAHPHVDCSGKVAVIHNGIVENYLDLKAQLEREGHAFRSQTDTEVIPHLIEKHLRGGMALEDAVRRTALQLEGAHAIVVVSEGSPHTVVGARIGHAGGLVAGYGHGAMYLASDLPAIVGSAKSAAYLENREMAVITPKSVRYMTLDGTPIEKHPHAVVHDPVSAAKGPYKHFMLKEIMEQPETLVSALRDRVDFQTNRVTLPDFPFDAKAAKALRRVVFIGMGTSYHSAMVGKLMLERLARIPVEIENASELRYRDPVLDRETLVVSVTQSGETVDTLVAMAEAKKHGCPQIVVCNVAGSEATRVADYSLLINAGPEIAVASTKTLTGSMVCLFLLGAVLGDLRGTLPPAEHQRLVEEVSRLPKLLGEVVESDVHYERLAKKYAQAPHFLILGRGFNYPTALEGALKLKEISYIHAEGYQGGEMKHGPIALIDEHMPVVAIALKDRLYGKMMGNIEEVRARDGRVIAIATQGDEAIREKAEDVLYVPEVTEMFSPVVAVAPLQLLAYHIAIRRGCDVDQPRNLAKTVTVE